MTLLFGTAPERSAPIGVRERGALVMESVRSAPQRAAEQLRSKQRSTRRGVLPEHFTTQEETTP